MVRPAFISRGFAVGVAGGRGVWKSPGFGRAFGPVDLGGRRPFSSSQEPELDEYELKIYNILQDKFKPRNLVVKDVSGGCGSMFSILVESEKFKGVPMIKQHRLVNEVLKDEIAKWHGIQLKTKS